MEMISSKSRMGLLISATANTPGVWIEREEVEWFGSNFCSSGEPSQENMLILMKTSFENIHKDRR